MATEVKRLMETETGRDGGGFVFVLNESLAAMFDFLPNSAEQLQGWKSLHLAGGPALNTKSCVDCCLSPNPSLAVGSRRVWLEN